MWNKFFVRDQFAFGILIGIVLPSLFYFVVYGIDMLVFAILETHILAKQTYIYMLSLAANLFAIKYYFVNLKYDKTGRGVLLVTFALALAYFAIFE